MDARYVVTGCDGFVGFHLVDRLLNQGASVLGIDRSVRSRPEARFRPVSADLSQPIPDFKEFHDATVIHTAAIMNSPSRETLWQCNVTGTFQVLEWALRHEARQLVFFSSGGVYGYADAYRHNEADALDPIGYYGYTKRICEQALEAYFQLHGLAATSIRLFFPYGPGQERGILPFIRRAVGEGIPLSVHNGGSPRINPIHIEDILTAMELVVDSADGHRCYNLCGDEEVSFADLVELYEQKLGRQAKIESTGQDHGDLLGDNSRLKSELDWSPAHSLMHSLV